MRKIIVITGPTAVGKTEYAIKIASNLGGEIVSCDSMQLYKYMDIGSAKPTVEERNQVRHYLVDLIDPGEPFSVAKYQKLAKDAIEDIFSRDKIPVIAGGTGLYLNSLLYEMNFAETPSDNKFRDEMYELAEKQGATALHNKLKEIDLKAAMRIHPNNIKRVIRALEAAYHGCSVKNFNHVKSKTREYDAILLGLAMDRKKLYDRINKRVDILMEKGLENEVKALKKMGFTTEDIAMKGIGYKELLDYLSGMYNITEAVEKIKSNTRHYAKRQMTWFKKYEDMKWFDLSDVTDSEQAALRMTEWIKEKL